MEYNQASAAVLFTASTIIIVISIMLMTSSWKSLKEIMRTLPTDQRRIYPLLRLREIEDDVARDKEIYKNLLWTSALVLGINVFINTVSLISIAALFVGINFGFQETAIENFNGARYMMLASPLLLFIAIILIGLYRFHEFMAMKAGKIDPEHWQVVEKKDEVKVDEDEKDEEREEAELQ